MHDDSNDQVNVDKTVRENGTTKGDKKKKYTWYDSDDDDHNSITGTTNTISGIKRNHDTDSEDEKKNAESCKK